MNNSNFQEGSQLLFDDEPVAEERIEKDENEELEPEQIPKPKNSIHWMFAHLPNKTDATNHLKRFQSLESMKLLFDNFIKEMEKKQIENKQTASHTIQKFGVVNKCITFNAENMKTLFRNDVTKLPRNMNPKLFQQADREQLQNCSISYFTSNFSERESLPRKNKRKSMYSFTVDDLELVSDNDAFEESTKKPRRFGLSLSNRNKKPLHPKSTLINTAVICEDKEKQDDVVNDDKNTPIEQAKDLDVVEGIIIPDEEEEDKDASFIKSSGIAELFKSQFTSVSRKFFGNKDNDEERGQGSSNKNINTRQTLLPTLEKTPIENEDDSDPPPALKRINKKGKELKKVECPMCQIKYSESIIQDHAFHCQGVPTTKTRSQSLLQRSKGNESFDSAAWEIACSGLKTNDNTTTKKPEVHTSRKAEKNPSPRKKWSVMSIIPSESTIKNHSSVIADSVQGSSGKGNIDTWNFLHSNEPTKERDEMRSDNTKVDIHSNINQTLKSINLPKNSSSDYTKSTFKKQSNVTGTRQIKRRAPCFQDDTNDREDVDIFNGYISSPRMKKPAVQYTKRGRRPKFLNDTMDDEDGVFKCSKCEKLFTEDVYLAHTEECLSDSSINFSQLS